MVLTGKEKKHNHGRGVITAVVVAVVTDVVVPIAVTAVVVVEPLGKRRNGSTKNIKISKKKILNMN